MSFLKQNIEKIAPRFKVAISLGFILSFALIIRLVPVIFVSQELPKTQAKLLLRGDAPPFNQWAIFFVKQGPAFLFNPRFNMCDPKIRMTVVIRNSKRMPIYPLFLYLIYSIFGINLTAAMVSKILLDLLTLVLVYLLAKELFHKEGVALLAGFLYAFDPAAVQFSSALCTETLFVFFFVLTVLTFIKALLRPQYWKFVLSGFLIGLTTLTKPITEYFVPFMAVAIFFQNLEAFTSLRPIPTAPVLKRIFCAFFLILSCLVTFLPWQLRNLHVYGHFSLTSQRGTEMWRVRSFMKYGRYKNDVSKEEKKSLPSQINSNNPFDRSQAQDKVALQYIGSNTGKYIKGFLGHLGDFFMVSGFFEEEMRIVPATTYTLRSLGIDKNTIRFLSKIFSHFLIIEEIFFVIGLSILLWSRKMRAIGGFIYLLLAYMVVIHSIIFWCADFRAFYLVMPFIITVAVGGLDAIPTVFSTLRNSFNGEKLTKEKKW